MFTYSFVQKVTVLDGNFCKALSVVEGVFWAFTSINYFHHTVYYKFPEQYVRIKVLKLKVLNAKKVLFSSYTILYYYTTIIYIIYNIIWLLWLIY